MPKFRYSWPFYLAVLGNIFMWEEILTSSLFNLIQQIGWVRDGEIYRVFVFTLFSFGLYGLSIYYIWINRFPRDQKWLITIIGAFFPIFMSLLAAKDSLGMDMKEIFTICGMWCLAMGIPFVIRMLRKPERLKTKWTNAKYVILISLFAGGLILGIMSLTGLFKFSFYGGKNGNALLLYLLALQIGLPGSLLLNMLDHHYRFLGRGRKDVEEKLIEELGKE